MAKAKPRAKRKRAPAKPAKYKQVYDEIECCMENLCSEAPGMLYAWVTEMAPEKIQAELIAICKKMIKQHYTKSSIDEAYADATAEIARLTTIKDLIAS